MPPPRPPLPALLTVTQAAQHLGLSEKAVRHRIDRGFLPARKLGKRVLIPRKDLEECLDALPRAGSPPF